MGTSTRRRGLSIGVGLAFAACGGGTTQAPTTPPAPAPAATATPAPTPAATPAPSPSADARCGSLPPGPVTRVTVAPRQHDENGAQITMRVMVRTPFSDEVLCLDKDMDHKIDFNLNQRNEDGRESCWVDEPGWKVRDPDGIVTDQQIRDDHGFILRVRVSPKGKRGRVGVSAELDGVRSYPWQSGAGYTPGPVWIEAIRREELKDCACVYLGNAGYQGEGCPKTGY